MPVNKSVICPIVVGRADDLAAIKRLREKAAQGQGQIALISGEAGLGKSRLISESIDAARQLETQVFKGNCFEADRAVPYAPLLDLLRNFYADHAGSDLSPYFGSSASELSKILPELAETIPDIAAAPSLEPEQEKHRLFQALAQFLMEQSKTSAVLMVVEDLHWSDDTSLEFLIYFARRIQSQKIFLLLTYRGDELTPALEHFLAELDRERLATELSLTRLSFDDVNEMLRAIFDLNRPIRPEFMNVIYPLTEGNPFFIEEILKSLITTGEIFYTDGTWDRKPIEELNIPRSIQDALHRRTNQLSAPAREVLSLAAVMGQRFDFYLLQDLAARDEAELLPLIKELMAVQLIVEESVERFSFRHALTRQAVYSQLMERERTALHQRIGESIERIGSSPLEEQFASLAYHFYRANAWQKAMEYSQRAGERAQALYAPRAAIEHFTHAIDSARQLGLPPLPAQYLARGSANERLGDFERARADYESALAAARHTQDRKIEWQSLSALGALWAGRDYSQTGEYYQRAYETAREISDPEMLAQTLNRLGNWKVNVDKPDEGLQYHQEALKLFQTLGHQKGLAETFDLLGMANYIHGDLIQSELYYTQAVEIFRQRDDREGLASSLASMMLNSSHLQSGMAVTAHSDQSDAIQRGEEALRIAREIGWRSGEAYALIMLGNYFGIRGAYSKAFSFAKMSLAVAQEIEHSQWITYSHYSLGTLYLDILAPAEARQHLEHALTLANQIGSRWWVTNVTGYLALTYFLENDLERAASLLATSLQVSADSFIGDGIKIDAPTLGQRLCWYAYAELALSRGDPDAALHILDQLLTASANLGNGQAILGLSTLRGKVLMALNRFKEAEDSLLAAQETAQQEGEKPLLWRIHAALGKLYQIQARREPSNSAFAAARKVIEEITETIEEADLRENFAKRALADLPRPRPLSGRQTAKQEFDGLTAREREVAAMIAEGKPNREIADKLVVSERTIETHVGNMFSKLGFSSRAQIAAWAVEKGLGRNKEN